MDITEEELKSYFPSLCVDEDDLRCTCPICGTESLTFSSKYHVAYCFTCKKGEATWKKAVATFYHGSENN